MLAGKGSMNPPLPWVMNSAEVRLGHGRLLVSVHNYTVAIAIDAAVQRCIVELVGYGKSTDRLPATVWLIRRGIRVAIGPYAAERRLPDLLWKYLQEAEIRLKEEAYAA